MMLSKSVTGVDEAVEMMIEISENLPDVDTEKAYNPTRKRTLEPHGKYAEGTVRVKISVNSVLSLLHLSRINGRKNDDL